MVSQILEHQRVRQSLMRFGLTEREAGIYLELATGGKGSAGDIARRIGLHKLDVYHDLKNLQDREMVEASLSRPMVYKANLLREILRGFERANREEVRSKAEALLRLRQASNGFGQTDSDQMLEGRDGVEDNNTIRIISGRKAIRAKWKDLLNSAKKEILIAATERGPARSIFLGLLDSLSVKLRRGVKVRVFTPVRGSDNERMRRIGPSVRHLVANAPAGLCVIDRTTAMIIVGPSKTSKVPGGTETALITNSRSIGEMLRTLFFVGWSTSPGIDDVAKRGRWRGDVPERSGHRRILK